MQNTEYLKTVSFELAKEALFNCNFLQVKDLVSVGSTEINGKLGEDVDVLALIQMTENMYVFDIDLPNWQIGGSMLLFSVNSDWASFKREVDGVIYNMIVTTNAVMYNQWKIAVEICKYINHLLPADQFLDKGQRCAIHAMIMDGYKAEDAIKPWFTVEEVVPTEIYIRV